MEVSVRSTSGGGERNSDAGAVSFALPLQARRRSEVRRRELRGSPEPIEL
jgi:hypothetical protein